jgi:hypothetical protein
MIATSSAISPIIGINAQNLTQSGTSNLSFIVTTSISCTTNRVKPVRYGIIIT